MTDARTYGTPERMPRDKLFPIRITLPLTATMIARVDAARQKEARVDFIREAIERELKRRERQKT